MVVRKSTKAQIKVTETTAILIIFFILLIFGLVFYSHFQKRSIKAFKDDILEKQTVINAIKVAFLPELACPNEPIGSCIDVQKMNALNTILKNKQNLLYYGFNKLTIKLENKINGKSTTLVKYDGNFTKKSTFSIPVLAKTQTGKYFAILSITQYD
ncbi:hypothetical protein DRZ77_02825 [Candidatus Woesearchaeota archaeon]|nr:hypothetical protein [Candidatus Woesearchaeota archaeon]RLE40215.1 MAG: hypothetical protein DRZ77_02825 [Candidatus Woesearchaeota archaeon]